MSAERASDCVRLTAMLVWEMDEVSAGHVGGTHGLGIVSSARHYPLL